MRKYPRLILDLDVLRGNIRAVADMCKGAGITPAFVIKGCNGIVEAVKAVMDEGAKIIATSRLEQFERVKDYKPDIKRMMIRIPAISELPDTVRLADMSLVSETETLKALDKEAGKQHKVHEVILMQDLGDLREGFWDKDELIRAALYTVKNADNLKLVGIGTNLGCYGAVEVTEDNMKELAETAQAVEEATGEQLQYISGGATTAIPLVLAGGMPKKINMLRIGEAVLTAKDLEEIWRCSIPGVGKNVFTLEAEIIEVKDKPTYPKGKIKCDAFGFVPEYKDMGIRKRAIAAVGKVDYGYWEMLEPTEDGIEVIGASSDHTILDIHDAKRDIKIGDKIKFGMKYANMVFATGRSDMALYVKGDMKGENNYGR